MKMRRSKILATEVFKTVRKLNSNYHKELSTKKFQTKARMNIMSKHYNTTTYGTKSLEI